MKKFLLVVALCNCTPVGYYVANVYVDPSGVLLAQRCAISRADSPGLRQLPRRARRAATVGAGRGKSSRTLDAMNNSCSLPLHTRTCQLHAAQRFTTYALAMKKLLVVACLGFVGCAYDANYFVQRVYVDPRGGLLEKRCTTSSSVIIEDCRYDHVAAPPQVLQKAGIAVAPAPAR